MNHLHRSTCVGRTSAALLFAVVACSRSERAEVAEPTKSALASPAKLGAAAPRATDAASCVLATAAPSSGNVKTGAGCGRPAETGTLRRKTTDGAGNTREYELLVPQSYDPQRPLAVTFVYHGAGGDEGAAKRYGLQDAPGAAQSSIFVFPRGIPFESYGIGWNDKCSGYDMPFFDHMLAAVAESFCVDPARVFATGFSWGGDHVTALACCRGSQVRAIAPASCSDEFDDPANHCTYQNAPCPNAGNTAVRFTFDRRGDGPLSAQQYKATGELFRGLGRCSASALGGKAPCVSYEGCTQPYVECGYSGLGHTLPKGWANDTWQFFASF